MSTMLIEIVDRTKSQRELIHYLVMNNGKDVLTFDTNAKAREAADAIRALNIRQIQVQVAYNLVRLNLAVG